MAKNSISPAKTPTQSYVIAPEKVTVLGLMAKYWEPGKVKTRLGVKIGMNRSARLHKLFVTHLTHSLNASPNQFSTIRRILVGTPTEKTSLFAQHMPPSWEIEPQADGDLGARMQHWFSQQLGGAERAILIGADCPTLEPNAINDAAQLLDTSDLVLGPCLDGGYYLIGIRGPWTGAHDNLFAEMPWSTDDVFAITCQRASSAGLQCATLGPQEDIDTVDELQRLRDALKRSRTHNSQHALLADQIESILNDETLEGSAS